MSSRYLQRIVLVTVADIIITDKLRNLKRQNIYILYGKSFVSLNSSNFTSLIIFFIMYVFLSVLQLIPIYIDLFCIFISFFQLYLLGISLSILINTITLLS